MIEASISAIVPTIGRPESLERLLESLGCQTVRMHEIIVADASNDHETDRVIADQRWSEAGLNVRCIRVDGPNAVRQRQEAIASSQGEYLLLLDDDVELEPDCIQEMLGLIQTAPDIVGVMADFNNERWPEPTRLWRFYLRYGLGIHGREWQGRVIGPLLRFGYNPTPKSPQQIEWLGTGNSLIRRSGYLTSGGFSDFFLGRSTMNEDVDLGLRLSRIGRIFFCPSARMTHHYAPTGRVSAAVAAEDDLYNRFLVLRHTCGKGTVRAFCLVTLFIFIETTSHFLGCVKRLDFAGFMSRLFGRFRGAVRIALSKTGLSHAR